MKNHWLKSYWRLKFRCTRRESIDPEWYWPATYEISKGSHVVEFKAEMYQDLRMTLEQSIRNAANQLMEDLNVKMDSIEEFRLWVFVDAVFHKYTQTVENMLEKEKS